MEAMKIALLGIVGAHQPATVRQIYYLAVSAGIVDKTEASYKNVVVRLLGQLRLEGRLPFSWLVDNTRWMRKPTSWSSLEKPSDPRRPSTVVICGAVLTPTSRCGPRRTRSPACSSTSPASSTSR
jgi:hypothetical protein